MRRLAVFALAASALLSGTACGGGGGSSATDNDIAKAAEKTAKAGSLEADFAISGAGLEGNGTGVFNTGQRTGQLKMTITAGGRQIPVDTILTGNVFYMRSPVFAQAVTGGKQWIKLDLAAVAKQRGADLSGILTASPTPANALAYLRGTSDVKKVGSDSVQGVNATHYKVNVDLQRAASKAKGSVHTALEQVISQSRLRTLPLDVWVDGTGYVRRVTYEEHAGRQQPARVTMELHDFGSPVSIKPPPSDSVVDLMKTLQQGG